MNVLTILFSFDMNSKEKYASTRKKAPHMEKVVESSYKCISKVCVCAKSHPVTLATAATQIEHSGKNECMEIKQKIMQPPPQRRDNKVE